MTQTEDFQALTKAFSGLGVDEKSIISIAGKWRPEQTNLFRRECEFFKEDNEFHAFTRWDSRYIKLLELEFLRLKEAVVLWTTHPWERDARIIKESLNKGPQMYDVVIEIACTRSSEELLGARKAYHSLFDHSVEEDIAHRVSDAHRNLLVALVSSYRYQGPKVNEDLAKADAKIFANVVKTSGNDLLKNDDVLRILATRSKPFLKVMYNYYKKSFGKNLDEDLKPDDLSLRATVESLCSPHTYFSKVLDRALDVKADEHVKDALTRVVVTRADTDMKAIKEEYQNIFGVQLVQKIEATANGSYKEFLLTLIAKGN